MPYNIDAKRNLNYESKIRQKVTPKGMDPRASNILSLSDQRHTDIIGDCARGSGHWDFRPGFRLLAVNDVKVDGSRTAHVHDLIKGPVGSTVQMMFAIDGEEHGDYDRKTLLGEVIASSFKVLRTDSRPSSSRVSSASEAITYFASPSHVTMTVVRAKLDRPSPSSVSTAVRMSGALATASPADSPVLKQRESTTPAHAN